MNNKINAEIVEKEVCAVLNNLPKEKYNKIPKKIQKIFKKYDEESKSVYLDLNISFDEQKISKEAKDIIFVISFMYWLNDEEKKQVTQKLKMNEEELMKKYNIEEFFKKKNNL